MFNFLIFDLDDTLIATSALEDFRGGANVNVMTPQYHTALRTALVTHNVQPSITEDFLLELRKSYPEAKFSVVTTSPKFYASTLLAYFYPKFTWDSIVGFEDVKQTKPDPEGLYLAFEKAGCNKDTKFDSIVLIGDSKKDIIAAYRSGIRVILYSACWPERMRPFDYHASNLIPDAHVKMQHKLREAIDAPLTRLPAFEAAVEGTSYTNVRAAYISHFINHEDEKDANNKSPRVSVMTLGRLFSEYATLENRRSWHIPTQHIHAHKNALVFPHEWTGAILRSIAHATAHIPDVIFGDTTVIITCIPHKPGRVARLERLVEQLQVAHLDFQRGPGTYHFAPALLAYKPGALSHHGAHLTAEQRIENVRDNLYVNEAGIIFGQIIIVLDDVVTTGASLYFAEKYIKMEGASDVKCIALTQAIGNI